MKTFYRKIAVVIGVLLPVALFFVTREKLGWRPVKVATFVKNAAFAISPDERFIAVSSKGKSRKIVLRSLENGQEISSCVAGPEISDLTFSSDSKQLAWVRTVWTEHEMANSTHRTGVSLWDLKGKPRDFEMDKEDLVFDRPTQLRFSPDQKTLWLASSDNLRAWDIRSGKLKWQWQKEDMGRDSSFPFVSALSKDCQLYFRSDSDGYSVWHVNIMKKTLRTKLPFLADEIPEFSDDASLATYYSDLKSSYPVFETRTSRVLWRSPLDSPVILMGDKAIGQQENRLEVLVARSGKLIRTLPAVPKTYVLPFVSRKWLYSIGHNNETLYRQRLQ